MTTDARLYTSPCRTASSKPSPTRSAQREMGVAQTIETERLRLAPLAPADAAGPYLRWINDPDVNRYLECRFRVYDEAALRAYIERVNADSASYMFGMFVHEDDRHVGNIKLGPVNDVHRRADIGLTVWKPEWGNGYATEAITGVTRFAFDTLGLHKVTAGCYSTNRGSIRAFIKAGFIQESTRRSHYYCSGQWVDEWLFASVAPEAPVDS